MKIKSDFVTNSSSSAFIITINQDFVNEFNKFIYTLNYDQENYEVVSHSIIATTLKELQDYTNGKPFDWICQARGLTYKALSESTYKKCKEWIDHGDHIYYVSVDYNVYEKFDDGIQKYAMILEEIF